MIAGLQGADIDYHIKLARTIENRAPRFVGFRVRRVRTQRKADYRANLHTASTQSASRLAHPDRVYADRSEPVAHAFFAHSQYLVASCIRLQQGVIDVTRDFAGRLAFRSGEAEPHTHL